MKVACEMGHAKVVKVLSKFDHIDMNMYGTSAVRLATFLGDAEFTNGFLGVVKLLVDVKGVDPGVCENEAFRSACRNGHVGIVNLLLQTGRVDTGACCNEGFREACKNGHQEVVKLLLRVVRVLLKLVGSRSVDLSACGYEAVKVARENRNLAVLKVLVARGGNDVVTVALEMAEKKGWRDGVNVISEYGVV
ncbi:hypothetical protein HDU76_004704 [Blyttiomyces sp. JEL0837]|nr:hypothetical protein HDU76_004704 [Blyttiomyces sp. JEL0837]